MPATPLGEKGRSTTSPLGKSAPKLPWAVLEDQELDLVFFRKVFYRIRSSLGFQDETTGDIPLLSFQRAMGRLFRVLQIDRNFDATKYDLNGDGSVGWWEFCVLWKEEGLAVHLSAAERIYITFEEPNSSRLGRIASTVTLLAIGLSASTFIISTMPDMQEATCPSCKPEPFEIFAIMDVFCVALFSIEYVTRLVTAAFTRIELINTDEMVESMCCDESIQWPTRWQRLQSFFWAWPNLIDLAAILPSYITWAMPSNPPSNGQEEEEGGPNVIFKLIRLMRMVRAFRLGRKFEAVMIISRAMRRSVRALSVLVLNMILGMLIFGAIMFFVEGGSYDPKDGAYKRFVGVEWDEKLKEYMNVFDRSPYESIPASFWWVLVTCTTVGYGDHYPTTMEGQVAAGIAMVWSLCVLALPVGVIGANFAAVWQEYDSEKSEETQLRRNQITMVKDAIAQIDPVSTSRQLYIAVYHNSGMPTCSDNNVFIGEAECELELFSDNTEPVHKQLKLALCENRAKSDRSVSGTIFLNYSWTPTPSRDWEEGCLLQGDLALTVVRAVDLVPIDWTNPGFADPYVEVVVYPVSPEANGELKPQTVYTKTITKNIIPIWNETLSFDFKWVQDGVDAMREYHKNMWHGVESPDKVRNENAMQLEYFPAVKQMGDELRELREQTVPELNREVSDLKNMTREILELLRPPGLPAHSGSALLKG